METSVSSKVLLFGEYTVLNNGIALTVPYDKFSGTLSFPEYGDDSATSEKSNDVVKRFSEFMAHLPEKDIEGMDFRTLYDEVKKGIFFKSNIPQGYGLGSSGALVVAIFIRYFETTKAIKSDIEGLSKENLNRMKRFLGKLEGFFHGSSSGIDPLAILVNEPLLFQNSEISQVELPPYRANGENFIFLLDSKIQRKTDDLVNEYKRKCKDPAFKKALVTDLSFYSKNCINALISNKTDFLYENLIQLIKIQMEHLDYLIPDTLKDKVQDGIDSQDYFLKICGSGGGGYMLGFTKDWKATQKALNGYHLEVIHRY